MGRRKSRQAIAAANAAKRRTVGSKLSDQDERTSSEEYDISESSMDDGDSSDDDLDDEFFVSVLRDAHLQESKQRGTYKKNSRQTLARRMKHAKTFSQPITNFFISPPLPQDTALIPIRSDIVSFLDTPNDEMEPSFVCDVVVDTEEEDVPLIDRRIAQHLNAEQLPLREISSDTSSDCEDETQSQHIQNLHIHLQQLANLLTKTKHTKKLTCYQYFQYTVIEQYLQLVSNEGLKRMEASKQVADSLTYWKAGTEWKAKVIRRWSSHWCRFGQLPPSRRGKHQKTRSFIEDEDVQMQCMTWIRGQRGEITSR
jgi:hypothetical protein